MLLCAIPLPAEPDAKLALSSMEPLIVHAAALCSATAALVLLVAATVEVPLMRVKSPRPEYGEPSFMLGFAYLNDGCVMEWLNSGVVAPMVSACPCCGTSCTCAGSSLSVRVTVSLPPVDPNRCSEDTPRGTRPPRSGRLNVVEPSPAPNVVPMTPNRVA